MTTPAFLSTTDSDPFAGMMRRKEAARYIRRSVRTLERWLKEPGAPEPIKYGHEILLSRAQCDALILAHMNRPATDQR